MSLERTKAVLSEAGAGAMLFGAPVAIMTGAHPLTTAAAGAIGAGGVLLTHAMNAAADRTARKQNRNLSPNQFRAVGFDPVNPDK